MDFATLAGKCTSFSGLASSFSSCRQLYHLVGELEAPTLRRWISCTVIRARLLGPGPSLKSSRSGEGERS